MIDESDGQLVYALRIPGTQFRPKVFRKGTYTLTLTNGSKKKTIQGVKSLDKADAATLEVDLR